MLGVELLFKKLNVPAIYLLGLIESTNKLENIPVPLAPELLFNNGKLGF